MFSDGCSGKERNSTVCLAMDKGVEHHFYLIESKVINGIFSLESISDEIVFNALYRFDYVIKKLKCQNSLLYYVDGSSQALNSSKAVKVITTDLEKKIGRLAGRFLRRTTTSFL